MVGRIASYFTCFILVYLYIFSPPFQAVPIGMDKPVMLWAFIFITYKGEWKRMYRLFATELQLLLLIFCFSLFIFIVTCFTFQIVMFDLAILIGAIPCAYAICRFVEEIRGFKLDMVIINCAVVASLISLYLITNPETAYYFKTELLKYPEVLADMLLFRGNGLSDGLLFSYPVIIGICMGLILLGFYRNWFYYVYLLPMVVAIFTNARSGFVPVFAAIVILVLVQINRFVRLSTIIVLGGIMLFGTLSVVIEQNERLKQAFEWGMSSFDILGDLLEGKKSENIEILLSDDMQVYPESFDQWIIGSGEYVFMGDRRSTDIGYLLRLNYGGIFYLGLFFLLTLHMFLRLKKNNKTLALLLIAPVLYYMMKADFFAPTPAIRFYFLIYIVGVMSYQSLVFQENRALRNSVLAD